MAAEGGQKKSTMTSSKPIDTDLLGHIILSAWKDEKYYRLRKIVTLVSLLVSKQRNSASRKQVTLDERWMNA